MNSFQNIEASNHNGVFTITLSREQKRNAINEQTMDELNEVFASVPVDGSVKVAVLNAKGKDFCAGADLDWMRHTQLMDEKQLQQQNTKLERIFSSWFNLPVFTIAIIHGNIVGGGIGLVAASDLVVSKPDAKFRFSEVTLGLIPATIAPYVLQRTQSRFIRNAMMTATVFDTRKALENGLVDVIADSHQESILLNDYFDMLNKTEPLAVAQTKKLTNDLILKRIDEPVAEHTTRLLAQARKSGPAAHRIEMFFKSLEK
jgi:methylglutaconyl-CoA hydratase